MGATEVFDVLREGLWVALIVSLPVLGIALLVGIVIGLFQALTSIQEMTLTFIPKILAILTALIIFAPWMLEKITVFTRTVIINIPTYVR